MIDLAVCVGAYLLGAVPFGLLLARSMAGVDVRQAGSGNIGATNVARSAGKGLGVVTLVLDAAKGAAPVLVAEHLLHLEVRTVAMGGLFAVLGHVFPVYLRFRGGKGVATGLGVFLALAPYATLVAVAVFLALFAAFRVVSLGSLVASLSLVGALWYLGAPREVMAVAASIVLLILVRHAGNIQRLLRRSENKL